MSDANYVYKRLAPAKPEDTLLRRAEQVIEWLDKIGLGSVQKQNLREAIKAVKS